MKTVSGKSTLLGMFRGVVEYNQDPLQIGRCKVRIPSLHGKMTPELLEMLPWARPIQPTPSGEDSGTFIIPEVGTVVWVQFEGGNKQYPIFYGGYHGIVDGINEVPLESLNGMDPSLSPRGKSVLAPSAWTLYKSPKGTTIGGQDAPEKESFWIIDRAGQIFKSITQMRKDTPKRKDRNAIDGTQFDYGDTKFGKVVTIFRSLGGGFIRFVSEKFKEKIELASTDKSNERNSVLHLSSAQGEVKAVILSEDRNANQVVYVTVDGSNGVAEMRVVKDGILQSSFSVTPDGPVMYRKDPDDPPIQDPMKFEDTRDEVIK